LSRRALINLGKYALGIGLLAAVVWWNWAPAEGQGLSQVWQKHIVQGEPIHFGYLVLTMIMVMAAVLQTFIRWGLLVRAQGLPFTVTNSLRLGFVGYFFNTLLPGSVGGDLVKAVAIAREQSRRTVAVATIIVDRIVGLWALFWLVTLSGAAFWMMGTLEGESERACRSIILTSAGIVAASLVVWVVMGFLPAHRAEIFAGRLERIPKAGHAAAEFWRAMWMYRVQAKAVWIALVMAIVGHIGFVLGYFFAARTLQEAGQTPTLTTHFLIIPIGMAVQAGIPTPGGLGGGEAIFGSLYRLVGYPVANGVLMSMVNRIITWILGLVGYLVYLQMRPALQEVPGAGQAGTEKVLADGQFMASSVPSASRDAMVRP
jgi:uncharacterized protein (TIRG00374 family)